jgi:hypothetical protein
MSPDVVRDTWKRVRSWARHLASPAVLAHVACAALVLLDWVVYYPGNAWGDSLHGSYAQAVRRSYGDFFPPFLAVCVRGLLAGGLKFPAITLLQGLLGALGVYQFAYAVVRLTLKGHLTDASARLVACGVFLVLFLGTALKFYLLYFSNDSWEMCALLWLGAVWVRLIDRTPQLTPGQVRWRVVLTTLLAGVAMLSRFNAVVMLPGFVLLTWLALRPQGWKVALAFVLVLVALQPAANALIYRLAEVRREHPEDQILAVDLIGLCVEDESLRAQFPYTSSQLVEERWRSGYQPGNAFPISPWEPARIVKDPGCFYRGAHDRVAAEWRHALRVCPATLAIVKVKGFACHLLCQAPNWYTDGLTENDLGLRHNRRFEPVRRCLSELHRRAYADPEIRLVIARHPLWLIANLLLLLGGAGAYRVTGDRRLGVLTALLLLPLLYYLSYLLASANYCYRYMYPATLFVQTFALALAAGYLLVRVKAAARAFRDGGDTAPAER